MVSVNNDRTFRGRSHSLMDIAPINSCLSFLHLCYPTWTDIHLLLATISHYLLLGTFLFTLGAGQKHLSCKKISFPFLLLLFCCWVAEIENKKF